MRLRSLILAAAIAASPLASPPAAAAEFSTGWLTGGSNTLGILLVGIEKRELPGFGLSTVATVAVSNKGAPVSLLKTAAMDLTNPTGTSLYPLAKFNPDTFARYDDDQMVPTGSFKFLVRLPESVPGYARVVLRLFGPGIREPTLYSWNLADIQAGTHVRLSTRNLEPFDGRYRTSLGSLLTLAARGNRLYGSSHTVGAKVEIGPFFNLTPVSETRFAAEMGMTTTKGTSRLATLSIDARRNAPLTGSFETGRYANRSFVACPVAENDYGPWQDPMLRPGGYVWAKAERIAARRLANGKIRIEADMHIWNVSHAVQNFELNAGSDPDHAEPLRHTDTKQFTVWNYRLEPCAEARVSFFTETRLQNVDRLMFAAGLEGQPYGEWSLAEALAKADDAAPADRGSGGGDDGPSTPTRELPASGSAAPASLRSWSNYGIWDLKVEELAPGPDGHWQAVVRVRDAATYRVGLAADGVVLTLFDDDGRSVASSSALFRASVTGAADELEPIPQTMWMEKGDEIRIRLLLRGSTGFKPVRVRLGSGDRETFSRTFNLE
jgi:hypothetical protein